MPISQYDKYFGGKGSAEKALKNMKRTYGDKDGDSVFHATVAKRKRKSGNRKFAHKFLGG